MCSSSFLSLQERRILTCTSRTAHVAFLFLCSLLFNCLFFFTNSISRLCREGSSFKQNGKALSICSSKTVLNCFCEFSLPLTYTVKLIRRPVLMTITFSQLSISFSFQIALDFQRNSQIRIPGFGPGLACN